MSADETLDCPGPLPAVRPVTRLAELRPGQRARVCGLRLPEGATEHGHSRQVVLRLLEIGFVEGESVRVTALGPGGREPIAVRVGSSQFALRRHEAEHVLVEIQEASR